MRLSSSIALGVVGIVLTGCGSDSSAPYEAVEGSDAAEDSSLDAGTDASMDDAGTGADGASDAGKDTSPEATDAGKDTGPDASDAGDTSPEVGKDTGPDTSDAGQDTGPGTADAGDSDADTGKDTAPDAPDAPDTLDASPDVFDADGDAPISCPTTQRLCQGSCRPCPSSQVVATGCAGAACVATSCKPGFGPSEGLCKPTCSSPLECTAVNETCNTIASVCTCRPDTHDCGGVCSSDTSLLTCGASCTACPVAANAISSCIAGVCGLTCNNGATLCGGTCSVCPVSPGIATTQCSATSCVVATCSSGYTLTAGKCLATPAGWHSAAIDPAISGGSVSLALDGTNNPHIAYLDGTTHYARYARFDGIGWIRETVTAVGAASVSLALDPADSPRIAYRSGGITTFGGYVVRGPSVWTDSSIFTQNSDNIVFGPSLVIDATSAPHIGYKDATTNTVIHAVLSSTWQRRTMATHGNGSPALAIDSARRVRATYNRYTPYNTEYSVFDGTKWTSSEVLPDSTYGQSCALGFDSSDRPHVAIIRSGGALVYALQTGTVWSTHTVETQADSKTDVALAVDGLGRPHLVYVEKTQRDLKYAYFDGTNWQLTTLVSATVPTVAASIAVDASNRPHIAYTSNGTLSYLWLGP